ncbi:hypothetical protein GCM10010406_36080 [Streptomyces thermolineatus]|uniref:Uncharacterized protein n=1 Tax=Streptomyces thermolineatus TaxID=44033 RepID=A0ABN3M689_9ACTN
MTRFHSALPDAPGVRAGRDAGPGRAQGGRSGCWWGAMEALREAAAARGGGEGAVLTLAQGGGDRKGFAPTGRGGAAARTVLSGKEVRSGTGPGGDLRVSYGAARPCPGGPHRGWNTAVTGRYG